MEARILHPDHLPIAPASAIARHLCLAALARSLGVACTPFAPEPFDRADFLARAQTQEADGLKVSVVALTPGESRRYLGEDLDDKGVQPVWLRIENQNDFPVWYLPLGTDPATSRPRKRHSCSIGRSAVGTTSASTSTS